MRAGDGAFINSSCSPNAMLNPCWAFHDEPVLLLDKNDRFSPKVLRNIIVLIRPNRYALNRPQ